MIKFEGVTFAYGEKQVLKDFSLEIENGAHLCLFGESGKCKTTLLRLICGLEKPQAGEITGIDKKRFSVVFQEDRLMPTLTALENVAAVTDEQNARQWLERVGLAENSDKKPSQLSGGMKRRVAIARALAFDADALILDEPFKGLEAELKESIAKLVCEYAQNKPVILVTHDEFGMSLAKNHVNLTSES